MMHSIVLYVLVLHANESLSSRKCRKPPEPDTNIWGTSLMHIFRIYRSSTTLLEPDLSSRTNIDIRFFLHSVIVAVLYALGSLVTSGNPIFWKLLFNLILSLPSTLFLFAHLVVSMDKIYYRKKKRTRTIHDYGLGLQFKVAKINLVSVCVCVCLCVCAFSLPFHSTFTFMFILNSKQANIQIIRSNGIGNRVKGMEQEDCKE